MKTLASIRLLFFISAAYDGLLGLAFLVAGSRIYASTGITPPNHWGYVDFPACILVLFGIMFLQIAMDPIKFRALIPYGVLLKVCYVGTVSWYWISQSLPDLWKYFAAADTVLAVLFLISLRALKSAANEA